MDRRSFDPYAPPPSGDVPSEPSADVSDGGINQPGTEDSGGDVELASQDPADDGLEAMRRIDLVDLAKQEGVASYGTHDDLVERIRKHRAGSTS
jgi:hypothetical protein